MRLQLNDRTHTDSYMLPNVDIKIRFVGGDNGLSMSLFWWWPTSECMFSYRRCVLVRVISRGIHVAHPQSKISSLMWREQDRRRWIFVSDIEHFYLILVVIVYSENGKWLKTNTLCRNGKVNKELKISVEIIKYCFEVCYIVGTKLVF